MLPARIEPARHPSVVRAAVSPTSVAVAAAGAVIGIFLVHSVLVAIVLGGGAWLARMALFALMRSLPVAEPDQVDPWAVTEPWRDYVRQAQAAGERFDRTVAGWPPGPLRERVADLQPRIHDGVREVWSIAKQGAASSPSGASVTPAEDLSKQLRQVQTDRQRAAGAAADALARQEEAIAAQLRAGRRLTDAQAGILDRLRLLTAQLDEAVTEVLELGVDRSVIEQVAGTVDEVVGELAALHQGLRQAGLPPGPPTSPATP